MDENQFHRTEPGRAGVGFLGASSWLVSAIGHLGALLVLLLLSLPTGAGVVPPLIVTIRGPGETAPQPEFTLAIEQRLDIEIHPLPESAQVQETFKPVVQANVAVARETLVGSLELPEIGAPLDTRIGGDRGEEGDAVFFGTSASGRDFVFILDCSGSMVARNGARFARARDELVQCISRLRPEQRFYVYLFNWSTFPMFGELEDPGELIPATEDNIARLRGWLYQVRPHSGTDPRMALIRSFAMRPDAIFLLSDGQFNTPDSDPLVAVGLRGVTVFDLVARQNRDRVQINTVAFEDGIAAVGMSRLAELADGQFRFVPVPGQEHVADQAVGKKQVAARER